MWDATQDDSDTPTRPNGTTTITRTVGLLNAYEYYVTYANSKEIASSSTSYLRNGVYQWLITPYNKSYVRYINNNGVFDNYSPMASASVRPSVNLKSEIQIVGGSGIESSPYILKDDIEITVNGTTLLSTRYSGEYVNFNNELYRIVSVENTLTKITSVNKPNELLNNKFHNSSEITNFSEASIKTDLENYYQNLDSYWKEMISENSTWYLGTISTRDNYKASICDDIDINISTKYCEKTSISATANIGLPRIGEMFTSSITRKVKQNFWTLTPVSETAVWTGNDIGTLHFYPTGTYGARSSMYLKSNVVIASDNTGNGTYEYPYSIELKT